MTRIALFTSISANIAEIAHLTTPNKLEYCLKHDYSLIIDNQKYEEAHPLLIDCYEKAKILLGSVFFSFPRYVLI